jgi:hypothetical protein
MNSAGGATTQRIATFVRWSRDKRIVVGGTVTLLVLAVLAAVVSGRIATRPSSVLSPLAPLPATASSPAARQPVTAPAAAPYAIPSEVKDEVSASAPHRAPPVAEAPEARAERVAPAQHRVVAPPPRGKHPAGKAEAPHPVAARSSAAASAAEASPPAPAAAAEPPRRSVASPEVKKRAQLVDDGSRVKLLE